MITQKTVLILGAGASKDYGYPLGPELKSEILELLSQFVEEAKQLERNIMNLQRANKLTYSEARFQIIKSKRKLEETDEVKLDNILSFLLLNCEINPGEIVDFYERFSRSYLNTIDTFLEERFEFLKLGRLLIAYIILGHENNELLYSRSNTNGWYNYLLNELGKSPDALRKSNLKIITYNYDRSLDHYILDSFINTFSAYEDTTECFKLAKHFEIFHIHGVVAPPSWGKGRDAKPYRQSRDCFEVLSAAAEIRIISETEINDRYQRVEELLNWAEQIFILGFGFDDRNMERLALSKYNKPIYASRTRVPDKELGNILAKANAQIDFGEKEDFNIYEFLRREHSLKSNRVITPTFVVTS